MSCGSPSKFRRPAAAIAENGGIVRAAGLAFLLCLPPASWPGKVACHEAK